ncbi:hypothetical protein HDR61_04965 [bacterium]|nr:hypothetical protein [bacterium]
MFERRKLQKMSEQFCGIPVEAREAFYHEFGMVMKIIRTRKQISLKEISDKLQITESALEGYEAGHEVPYFDIIALYGYLGMTKNPINYI